MYVCPYVQEYVIYMYSADGNLSSIAYTLACSYPTTLHSSLLYGGGGEGGGRGRREGAIVHCY